MKKNKGIAAVGVVLGIVAVLVIVWLIVYANRTVVAPSGTATSTPNTPSVNGNTNPPQNPVGMPAPSSNLTPGVPIVSTNPTASPSNKTVVVTGSITPNGAFTSYWFEYGTGPDLGSRNSAQTIGSGYNPIATPAYITGLSVNTTYYFRLAGENAYGKVTGTTYTFQTSAANPPPPVGSAPSVKTLAANALSRTSANLNGEINPDQAQTQYWFEYGKTSSLGSTSAFQSAGNGRVNAAVSISVPNLDPATTYFYRLNAQNQFGTVNGATMTFATLGPAVAPSPASPTVETRGATAISASGATLNGRVNPNGAETSYWFEYSTAAALEAPLLKSTGPQSAGSGTSLRPLSQNATGLASSTTYYYRVVAQNSVGLVHGAVTSFKTR
jgi:hypothetical protein